MYNVYRKREREGTTMTRIWFDMDGTIADLYNEKDWLEDIQRKDTRPFENAKVIIKEEILKDLEAEGYLLGIITWTPKNATREYCRKVRKAKVEWLKKNYPNINFDTIHCIKYGTNKWYYRDTKDDILVDDEIQNIKRWRGIAIEPKMFY